MKKMISRLLALLMILTLSLSPVEIPQAGIIRWPDTLTKPGILTTTAQASTKVRKITLTTKKLTLSKGETTTLAAEFTPENVTKDEVSWKSSNKKVAKVNSKGEVKGIKPGTATITATAKDGSRKKATCKVTVKSKAPNVDNSVMKMTAKKAAEKLWLTNDLGPIILKGEKTSRKGQLQTRVKVDYSNKNKKGMWDLFILDKSVSFYGIKEGMAKSKVSAALKKAGWKKTKEEKENTWDGYTNVYYKSTDSKCYAYKTKGTLEVRYDDKGRIWMIHYSPTYFDW